MDEIYPTFTDEFGIEWEFNYIVGFLTDHDKLVYRVKGTTTWETAPSWMQEGGVPKEIDEHFHGPLID